MMMHMPRCEINFASGTGKVPLLICLILRVFSNMNLSLSPDVPEMKPWSLEALNVSILDSGKGHNGLHQLIASTNRVYACARELVE